MLKHEFSLEEAWFAETEVHLDLGYQGIQTTYQGERIYLPHKKPRKSKHKPDPQLTPQQKQENRALATLRVPVEHRSFSLTRRYWRSQTLSQSHYTLPQPQERL